MREYCVEMIMHPSRTPNEEILPRDLAKLAGTFRVSTPTP
jgi:hypothetical protein